MDSETVMSFCYLKFYYVMVPVLYMSKTLFSLFASLKQYST